MSRSRPLLPDRTAKSIPVFYSQENVADPIAHCKFFHPLSDWSWFVVEYDPVERICFGLVHGLDEELGYFSLNELEGLNVHGFEVERDEHWAPRPLSQCRKERT